MPIGEINLRCAPGDRERGRTVAGYSLQRPLVSLQRGGGDRAVRVNGGSERVRPAKVRLTQLALSNHVSVETGSQRVWFPDKRQHFADGHLARRAIESKGGLVSASVERVE